MAAGLDPVVLLNQKAMEKLAPLTDEMIKRLGYKQKVDWVSVEQPGFVRTLIRAIRDQRPVITYIDGNGGQGGFGGTRERGLAVALPGRDIKVRTGLARLFCRLECPVHPVALHWAEPVSPIWHKEPTQNWHRTDNPDDVARMLFKWCFDEVIRRPEQWNFWEMLKESSACFSGSDLVSPGVSAGMRDDFRLAFWSCLEKSPATARLILETEVEVWPGDVLVDLAGDRFFAAEGMSDKDLDLFREQNPTLEQLVKTHGLIWTRYHGLRLCLLGLARLGG